MFEAYQLLELDRVLELCSEESSSELGRIRVAALRPSRNTADVRDELALVSEMVRILEVTTLPIQGLIDITSILEKLTPDGGMPDREEYLPLNDVLSASGRIKRFLSSQDESFPGLRGCAAQLGDFGDLCTEFDKIFDPTGEIRDDASAELKRIRRQKESEERRLHEASERVLRQWQKQGYTQEDTPAFREGKLLIPVKSEHRGRVQGVVQDESATGATVFVEPIEVIDIGNAIRRLQSEERREINRLLAVLCDQIRLHLPEIKLSLEILTQIDCIYARARFSKRLECTSPAVSHDPIIKLIEARHPLLVLKENLDVVPLTVTLGETEGNILVITGPNAGGKTVALKTIGLFCLMAACGLHVPAKGGTQLPVLASLHCDIGDPQSLEEDLSTYTSRLLRLKEALSDDAEPKLILLDEFGSGTDPAEGSAIARAALLEFRRQGALVVATTHHGTLKVFAHETGGIFNGSMEFDSETLRPTFRFHPGVPGSSYALEISARVGLDDGVLKQAEEFVGEQTSRMEDLLNRLNESLRVSEKTRREADLKKTEMEGLRKLYSERLEELNNAGKERLREAAREAKEILKNANKAIEAAVKEIREKQAAKEVIKKAHASVRKEKQKIDEVLEKGKLPDTDEQSWVCNEGDWVKLDELKDPVKVLETRKDGKEAMLEVGGIHIWMATRKLTPAKPPKEAERKDDVKVWISSDTGGQAYELDLRGMLADEAQFALEKYLSDCALSGWKTVRIIHGKGTGALRTRVQEVLKNAPGVKSFRYGRPEEGEFGVTVVELE